MKKRHKILVTRELTDQQLQLADDLGLDVTVEPAIRFEFRNNWSSIVNSIENAETRIFAFTSQNGVKAFQKLMDHGYKLPDGVVFYAVGDKTASALEELGYLALVPELSYGDQLGEKIASDLKQTGVEDTTVFHFCGNRRREEMRQVLEDTSITVKDLVVYETILNQLNLNSIDADGILFYSPSAVEAFRKSGGFRREKLPEFFAIGHTTARELSIESGRNVHISPKTNTEDFLRFTAQILRETEIE
jgi:uroporphyrinogen-III synthase